MTTVSIQDELQAIKNAALYRRLRRVENDQGPTLILDGHEVINFSSNNYLGIANHPALAEAAKRAIDQYGCGSGASRLISGNMALHEELENRLAKFKGTEAALVFNSGFQANTGILSTLTGETDAILSDALNHASIIDGCRLSRAKTFVYAHGDLNGLETGLKQAAGARRKLIVTETIFSMDGDEAPLTGIVELAEKYDAWVMVDEAHATGIFGASGAGVVAKLGLGRSRSRANGHARKSARRFRRLRRRQSRAARAVNQPLSQFHIYDGAAAGDHGDGDSGDRSSGARTGATRGSVGQLPPACGWTEKNRFLAR